MSPKLIAAMVGALSALGGAIVGALSRQPEINKLKKKVKQLQKEIERLQELRKQQDEQIEALFVKYKALKIYQFMKRSEARSNIRGLLIYQYGIHDYFDLLLKASRKEELVKEDVLFYNIFDKVIEGKEIVPEEKQAIKEYVTYKHGAELRRMKECDNLEMIMQIQNLDAKKL